ncbi:intercellular adhesion molecule 4-like [Protobothrops mucrosquamatus]|uniref:intercellular adhesion molecule 4-like n=1 Tax=Protobothrops mucrosquamatus TaxID=103944 RepID=UPI0010FAFB38|nr:intercellular adhesion molecule 4-like [Protobothrops mucrosquamatus]
MYTMEVKTWKLFTAFLCCIGFLLALSRAQQKDPAVPLRKAVKFGGFFVLNCTSSSSNSSCDIQERSSQKYDYRNAGPTWKAFTFIVDYWSLRASCVVTCNNEPRSWETIVTVYQPPKKIELYPVPEMEVGKLYNLTCQVFGVAPIRNLTVTLLKGEEQLLVKTFENYTHPEAGTVVVNHSIIAQEDDYSKTVTCQTSLDLRPTEPLLKNTSHGISLWTFGPLEVMTLELQKPSPGQNWAYNLICHIIRVDPCLTLVVTFFKGSKRLGTPSFTNCTWVEIENYTVTLPVTLHPEDHGQEAYCHAAVHFGLHEPVYRTKSSEVSLKTAESYLAIVVAVTAVAALLICVLVVFLIFVIRLWIHQ